MRELIETTALVIPVALLFFVSVLVVLGVTYGSLWTASLVEKFLRRFDK